MLFFNCHLSLSQKYVFFASKSLSFLIFRLLFKKVLVPLWSY